MLLLVSLQGFNFETQKTGVTGTQASNKTQRPIILPTAQALPSKRPIPARAESHLAKGEHASSPAPPPPLELDSILISKDQDRPPGHAPRPTPGAGLEQELAQKMERVSLEGEGPQSGAGGLGEAAGGRQVQPPLLAGGVAGDVASWRAAGGGGGVEGLGEEGPEEEDRKSVV